MDRDIILENFQAISQIQDFEECIQILESVDWNLDSALNSVEQSNHFSIPETESQANIGYESLSNQSRYNTSENRSLIFYVDIRGQTIHVLIDEDKTVGDLAELVASEIQESHTKFKINGLKMPYNSHTTLKSLKLPTESRVVANPVSSSFGHCSSSKATQSTFKTFNLSIDVYFNDKFHQKLNLTFEGKDSIAKVKLYLATLLGTDVNKQRWTGWPSNAVLDEMTLQCCGISENASFKLDVSIDQKAPKIPSRLKFESIKTPTEVSLNNSRIDEDEDDYYDYPDDIELMEQETEWTIKRSLALMRQDAHEDPMTATLYFSHEFVLRYCPDNDDRSSKPPFFIGSLEDALCATLNLLPKQRKPLFLYLHHGESIQANIFCTQVLCYNDIILYFTQSDFMIWPWDITYSENKSQLLVWLSKNFGPQVVSSVKIILKDQFPILMALGKSQGNVEVLEILDGSKSKDEILIHLWSIKSQFQDRQKVDISAWEELELRKQVKLEQDEAYKESLIKDQIKEKERNDKIRKTMEDEKNKILQIQKSEADRDNQISKALSKVPAEPEDGPDSVTIRLRLPPDVEFNSTSCLTRRFLYSHTLAHLIAYIESMGFLRTEFKLLMTYPRTNLTQIEDQNITLKSLGIPKRENLILERV